MYKKCPHCKNLINGHRSTTKCPKGNRVQTQNSNLSKTSFQYQTHIFPIDANTPQEFQAVIPQLMDLYEQRLDLGKAIQKKYGKTNEPTPYMIKMYSEYPSLNNTTMHIYDTLFNTLGNGYTWKGGKPYYKNPPTQEEASLRQLTYHWNQMNNYIEHHRNTKTKQEHNEYLERRAQEHINQISINNQKIKTAITTDTLPEHTHINTYASLSRQELTELINSPKGEFFLTSFNCMLPSNGKIDKQWLPHVNKYLTNLNAAIPEIPATFNTENYMPSPNGHGWTIRNEKARQKIEKALKLAQS